MTSPNFSRSTINKAIKTTKAIALIVVLSAFLAVRGFGAAYSVSSFSWLNTIFTGGAAYNDLSGLN
jgi:hypothetical protein